MNIMVVTINAWDDTNSIGNTISNWFTEWNNVDISNIFCRDANPNNDICKNYYRISDSMLVKNFLSPQKIGCEFVVEKKEMSSLISSKKESKVKSFVHKYGLKSAYVIQDFVWGLKGWKNEKLESFIKIKKPEILFFFAMPSVQYLYLVEYIRELAGCKVVAYIPDNVYGKFFEKSTVMQKRKDMRFHKILSLCDLIYGASSELCDVYSSEFGRDIKPLYKGGDFSFPIEREVSLPIRITYAGNLLFGRLSTIMYLAEIVDAMNENEIKVEFAIYSGTILTKQQKSKFQMLKGVYLCDAEPYETIKSLLHESDIVLHVESFDKQEIDKVKYSFSTKIIDCLQSGSSMLVIGPKGISSIEYSRKIPGAIVVDSVSELPLILEKIVKEPIQIIDNKIQIRHFAEMHHDIRDVQKQIRSDFNFLLTKREC